MNTDGYRLPQMLPASARVWLSKQRYEEWLSLASACGIGIASSIAVLDLGGVLPWTQWLVSVLVLASLLILSPVIFLRPAASRRLVLVLPAVLLLACSWAFIQQLPLPQQVVQLLSQGSATAFETIESIRVSESELGTLSLSPNRTQHWLSLGILVTASLWAITFAIRSARHITLVLAIFTVTGVILSISGVLQLSIDSTETVAGYKAPSGGYPFGTFINRNNAAIVINLAIASAYAVLATRQSRQESPRSGSLIPRKQVQFLWIAALGLLYAGVLMSGSRGGLLSCVIATIAVAAYVPKDRRRRLTPVLVAIAAIGIAATTALVGYGVKSRTTSLIQNETSQSIVDFANDPRLGHWPDGWRASRDYFPGGSGLGSYRFAYLPYIRTTHNAWYQHADNLWLEWWTELGLAGLMSAVCFIAVAVYGLHRIRRTTNPFDFGLGVAGVYAITSVLISQFFDFGVIWPGPAIMATTLIGLPVARATFANLPAKLTRQPSKIWQFAEASVSQLTVRLATICFIGLAFLATSQLSKAARSDYAIRLSSRTKQEPTEDSLRTAQLLVDRELVRSPRNADLLVEFADLQTLAARLIIFDARATRSELSATDLYKATDPQVLRREHWVGELADNPEDVKYLELPQLATKNFTAARSALQGALSVEPYNDAALTRIVTLDFLSSDLENSRQQLLQIILLRSNSSQIMRRTGELAADSQLLDIAAKAWRQCTNLRNDDIVPILRRIERIPSLSPDQVIGDRPEALATAAKYEIARPTPDMDLLQRAKPALRSLLRHAPVDGSADQDWGDTLMHVYVALGDNRDATKLAAASESFRNADQWMLLSTLLHEKHDLSGAMQAAKRALLVDSMDQKAIEMLNTLQQQRSTDSREGR